MRMVDRKNHDIIVRRHSDQNYSVYFDRRTGFFMRVEDKGAEEPFWSKNGPELLDIAITNWCDKNCQVCYRDSNKYGKHMPIDDYEKIIKQASELGVLQVALGGGNPNQHPDFEKILEVTRGKYGIVPSYTTNGRGLDDNVLNSTKKYCGAVAVSSYSPFKEMIDAIEALINHDIKTNIHFVLESRSIEVAIDWLKDFPDFLNEINAVIFLKYKPIGRVSKELQLLNNSDKIEKFFNLITSNKFPFKIGFDSCSVPGIVSHMDFNRRYLEACDAGRFSAFISESLRMYPCSFMVDFIEGEDLHTKKIVNVWKESPFFANIRQTFKNNECKGKCDYFNVCFGGCPIFEDINICKYR